MASVKKKFRWKSSLKVKITLLLLALSVIPLFALSFILVSGFTKTLTTNTDDELLRMAKLNADFMNTWISGKIGSAETMIKAHPEFAKGDVNEIMPLLKLMIDSDPDVNVSSYVDRNGHITSTTGEQLDGTGFPNIIEVMKSKKAVLSDIVANPATGGYTFYLDVPILDDKGEFAGAIQPEINADKFVTLVTNMKMGDAGYGYLISPQGVYLAHHAKEKLGKDFKQFSTPAKIEAFEQAVFAKSDGVFAYPEAGEKRVAGYATINTTGWKLVMTAPETQIYEMVNQTETKAFIAILISIGAIVVLSFVLSRGMLRPVLAISSMMQSVSTGDLTGRLRVKGTDELESLKENINLMLDSFAGMIVTVKETIEQVAASAEQLTASAEQTGKATEQIATTIQEVAAGTDRQVNSVEESSTTVRQMAQGARQIAAFAQIATREADQSRAISVAENEAIQTTIRQIGEVNQTMIGLAHTVEGLGSRSQEIGSIVEVISGIAAQTNLLALNAAIEAARAGEHGRGFAVVADEVRKLAEQSAQSAQQIAELIAIIQTETNQAVRAAEAGTKEVTSGMQMVQTAGAAFAQIQQSIQTVAQHIQEVSAAAEQMNAGTDHVVEEVAQISRIAENIAFGTQNVSASTEEQLASMEEVAASAGALARMTEELQEQISRFRV